MHYSHFFAIMIEIDFTVYGKIVPKGRPRATTIYGHPKLYTPKTTIDYERLISVQAKTQSNNQFLGDKKFALYLEMYFALPKNTSKKKLQELSNTYCTNKKDIDNVAKVVLDSLNGVLYSDDHNCVELHCIKKYDAEEYIKVKIKEIETKLYVQNKKQFTRRSVGSPRGLAKRLYQLHKFGKVV